MAFGDWITSHWDLIASAFVVVGFHGVLTQERSNMSLVYFLAASASDTWLQWAIVSFLFVFLTIVRGFNELFR